MKDNKKYKFKNKSKKNYKIEKSQINSENKVNKKSFQGGSSSLKKENLRKHAKVKRCQDDFKNTVLYFICDGKAEKDNPDKIIYLTDVNKGIAQNDFKLPTKDVFKKQANLFVRRLAHRGFFKGVFSKKDEIIALKKGHLPKGYVVDYFIPKKFQGKTDTSNMYVCSKEVSELMKDVFWPNVQEELDSFLEKGKFAHKIGLIIPNIPPFISDKGFVAFTKDDIFREYIEKKQDVRKKLSNQVSSYVYKNGIVLKLIKKAPDMPHISMKLIKINPAAIPFRDEVKSAYNKNRPEFFENCKQRGDIQRFCGTEDNFNCHHVIPLACGGQNTIDNLVILPKDLHDILHQNYINAIQAKVDFLQDENKDIYIEIPVPDVCHIPEYKITKKNIIERVQEKKPISKIIRIKNYLSKKK